VRKEDRCRVMPGDPEIVRMIRRRLYPTYLVASR